MKSPLKHIAVYFLLGIFFFPIAFQNSHIAIHQEAISKRVATDIAVQDHSNCGDKSTTDITPTHDEEEQCYVCDYQFSINNLPYDNVYEAYIPVEKQHYIVLRVMDDCQAVVAHKSPRAPPYL